MSISTSAPSVNLFQVLFGGMDPATSQISVIAITADGKVLTRWADSPEQAQEAAAAFGDCVNVYFGCGLRSRRVFRQGQRGGSEDIVAIPGVWIEIDIAGPGHKDSKKKYPPDRESVYRMLDGLDFPPTVTVDSGHGLQLFHAFIDLEYGQDEESHERIETLERRWLRSFQIICKCRGWDIDSTYDLSRVLRVPGTWNVKIPGEPKQVQIVHCDPYRRYTPEEIEARFCDDPSEYTHSNGKRRPGTTTCEAIISDDLILDPEAVYPAEKFDELKEVEPRFLATFERKRRDLKDTSDSGFDWTLARMALAYGWTDQEVINLLIHHRRKHRLDLKLRLSYYRTTLINAHKGIEIDTAWSTLDEIAATGEASAEVRESAGVADADDEETARRKVLLKTLSGILGFEICQVIKYTSAPPVYRLLTDHGDVTLGDVSYLTEQPKFRNKVAGLSGILIDRVKPDHWDKTAQMLLSACEEEDAGADSTEVGEVVNWLGLYLSEGNMVRRPLDDEIVRCQNPFIPDGRRLHVWSNGLVEYLNNAHQMKTSTREIGPRMKAVGAESAIVKRDINGIRTTRSLWIIPEHLLEQVEEVQEKNQHAEDADVV